MQRLVLPIDKCKFNAGYKLEKYKNEFGFTHYGVDLGAADGRTAVHGIGNGKVIAAGLDGANTAQRMGNAVVIVYPDVYIRKGFTTANGQTVKEGAVMDLACRMFHFAKLYVKAGDLVTPETIIGEYGNTGAHSNGAHLHIEFDVDASAPQYAYGIASSGNIIKRGTLDSTVDPSLIWYKGDGQTIQPGNATWMAEGWLNQRDLDLPTLPEEIKDSTPQVPKSEFDALQASYNEIKGRYDRLAVQIRNLAAGL